MVRRLLSRALGAHIRAKEAIVRIRSSLWVVGMMVISNLVATGAFAAPVLPTSADHERALRVEASADPQRGSISLLQLEDNERTLVAIAATFDATKYCDATSVIVTARVNGIPVEPPFPAFIEHGTDGCTATGIFRLDLDAAELVHPGSFIGQPLNVTLTYWG